MRDDASDSDSDNGSDNDEPDLLLRQVRGSVLTCI